MTEDIFGDGSADFGDDFSLASGIDEINYGDPFNSNDDNSNVVDIGSKKYKYLTMQDSTLNTRNHETLNLRKGPPTTIGDKTNLSELNACLFETKSDEGNINQITDNCNQHSLVPPSCEQSTTFTEFKPQNALLIENGIGRSVLRTADKKKNASIFSVQKPEFVATKARKLCTKNMVRPSKNDGLLTLVLKSKYRNTTAQQVTAARNVSISSSSSGFSLPHTSVVDGIGDKGELDIGKSNASLHYASGSQTQTHTDFVGGPDYRRYSLPPVKSSSMHDLLQQSKAQCKSQFLLRQSSAYSLSKRNSFQSIKYVNEKLDVSSLLPAKRYAKSSSASRRWTLPIAAGAKAESEFTKNLMSGNEAAVQTLANDGICDITDSLLHEACRLFPNSDTVVETALRVDPNAVRRSVVYSSDQDGDFPKKTNTSMYGYPINLAITHGANEKILKLLVESGSDVLAFKDGTDCGASLGIALSSKQCNKVIVDLLLSANEQCAQIADRRGNYPLHTAVSYGRSLDIVMRLYAVFPEAQGMRNFHSQTPLDIAIQSTRCPEEVMEFLRSEACCTSRADYMTINTKKSGSNQSFGFLEDGLDDIMQTNC